MHTHFRLVSIVALVLLALLAACAAQPQPTATPEATLDTTALAQGIAANIFGTLTAQPTNTLEPSATASPSPTVTASYTPTPSAPFIIASIKIPLRVGPGSEFKAARYLEASTPMPVLEVSEDGRWVRVTTPEAETYTGGGWVGLSPQVAVYGNLSDTPIENTSFSTPTMDFEMLSRITATASAKEVLALIPASPTPAPTLDVNALAADIQAEVAETLLSQLPTAAPTLDMEVLVGTAQAGVIETLVAQVTQQVAQQATLQAGQQATQTAVAGQPAEVSADDDPFWGPEDAKVTIIEFSDFSCPHCRDFALDTLPRLKAAYSDRVRFVFRDAPILGPASGWAALAAECADDQGKFWEYHELLFANQGSLSRENLTLYARQLDLNMETFDTCVDNQTHIDELRKDLADAQAAGVSGTPTFFINGQRIVGAQPYELFVQVIDEELAKVGLPTGPAAATEEATEAAVAATEEATEAGVVEVTQEATVEATETAAPTATPRS